MAVMRHHTDIAREFTPGRFDGSLLLFTAADEVQGAPAAELADRWRAHLTGPLTVRDVACGHEEMLGRAAARRIGEVADAALRRS